MSDRTELTKSGSSPIAGLDLRVRLDEIVPTKRAARQLPAELGRIQRGEVEQIVLTTRNTPRAVIVSIERYGALLRLEAATTGGQHAGI